ncbi:hypothetical protein V2J09_005671 [Rumex salicifolius]
MVWSPPLFSSQNSILAIEVIHFKRDMTELKRRQSSADHRNISFVAAKRQKAEMGTSMTSKEAKEKVGERILALQQIVSPYGKTDTASVLSEAIEYIRFLHEQVKVLCAPYLFCDPVNKKDNVAQEYSLNSRGLCLVPISSTVWLARSNGADIWTPIQSTSPRF